MFKIAAADGQVAMAGFIQRKLHIGQDFIHIILFRNLIGVSPEIFGTQLHGREKSMLLHISGGQGSVKIVGNGYFYELFRHNLVCLVQI